MCYYLGSKVYLWCNRGRFISVVLDQLCCTVVKTWELTFTDEARLCVVEHYIIRMMCGVKLINRLSTDVSQDRVGIVVKIKDIIQSHLWWYGHVIHWHINSQICKVTQLEMTGERKKGWPRKFWEECVKKDLEWYGLRREDAYNQEKWWEQIKAKLTNPSHAGRWH